MSIFKEKTKQGAVLVTGGAGYIGTNVCLQLLKRNYNVVVVDNLSNSKREHIARLLDNYPNNIKLYECDMLDKAKLREIFCAEHFVGCIHLAGKKYVAESFVQAEEYYINNVILTQILLELMEEFGVRKLVFSSSITVYGQVKKDIFDENSPLHPLSPYAKQKLECEQLVAKWQQKNCADVKVLRLSNPVGANVEFGLCDDPLSIKYLGVLPYIIEKAINREKLVFNGGNYPTKDGSTIRDFIHVEDVASAFVKALEYNNNNFDVFNIGCGMPGYSVLDILKQTEKSLNVTLEYSFGPRREGDIAVLIANNNKAVQTIAFCVTKNLQNMVESHAFVSGNNTKQ